jgi:hypothetical protein
LSYSQAIVAPAKPLATADLHLPPKTVDFHLQNIYSKVGITSRAGWYNPGDRALRRAREGLRHGDA